MLIDRILQSSDAINCDTDDIAGLQRKRIRRDDAGSGEQETTPREGIFAEQVPGENVGLALHLLERGFVFENWFAAAEDLERDARICTRRLLLHQNEPPGANTRIALEILRSGKPVFEDETTLQQMKREPDVLARYLFRENSFPRGCFLLTGTGIVPPDSFTLQPGDIVRITIDGIGTLENPVD